MGFKIVNGKDFVGSVRKYSEEDIFHDRSGDYYRRLIEDSQMYFLKLLCKKISLEDRRYFIYAPSSYRNQACYVEHYLPDDTSEDSTVLANHVYVSCPIIVQEIRIPIVGVKKYRFSGVYGRHLFMEAKKHRLNILVNVEEKPGKQLGYFSKWKSMLRIWRITR